MMMLGTTERHDRNHLTLAIVELLGLGLPQPRTDGYKGDVWLTSAYYERAARIVSEQLDVDRRYFIEADVRRQTEMVHEAIAAVSQADSNSTDKSASIRKKPNRAETLLGDDARRIMEIAASDQSADNRMREICGIDRTHLSWDSPRWAELLGVTDAAIRKTRFWKHDRQKAIEADRVVTGR